MGEYVTRAVTKEQYQEIIKTIQTGFLSTRPNKQVATCLVLEANLGMRVGDILNLTLNSFIRDGERYRLDIVEQKTQKKRNFTVPKEIYNYIKQYCVDEEIKSNERIFYITTRQVQRILKRAVEFLGYTNISTHSFRKFYATQIYINSNYNIKLVQVLLQHASIITTQNYVTLGAKELEEAIQNNMNLL